MIQLANVEKAFAVGDHRQQVLRGVNLKLEKGELVSIQGRSGSGKTTLLHIMACLDRFDYGSYYMDSMSIAEQTDRKLVQIRNRDIGIILQDYVLLNHCSVLFNVMLPMYFNNTPYKTMREKAMSALDMVGIQNLYKKNANRLSGGERQRVAIARAIVNNPQLILADEPTGALDYSTGQDIMQLIKQINATGVTVVVVTHDAKIADSCERHLVMDEGVLIENEPVGGS